MTGKGRAAYSLDAFMMIEAAAHCLLDKQSALTIFQLVINLRCELFCLFVIVLFIL